MEINKYTDIIGVVVTEDIVEGRMVLLCSAATTVGTGPDFGSQKDLMGVRVPQSTAEALKAKYIVTWPVSNAQATSEIKMLVPMPAFTYSLRKGGWDQAANVPFAATIYLTYPGNQENVTIPSGYLALAFDRGVFTVPSGQFVYSANLVPGAPLEVLNTGDDGAPSAGKLAYNSAGTIAVVERYDSTDNSLTFRTL
jgi:hypothetical protein